MAQGSREGEMRLVPVHAWNDVDMGVADGQGVGREGHVGRETHGVAERGRKRRGTGECEGGAGAWRPCALGEVWVLGADARTGTREVRLAEVVAGRRRKRASCQVRRWDKHNGWSIAGANLCRISFRIETCCSVGRGRGAAVAGNKAVR